MEPLELHGEAVAGHSATLRKRMGVLAQDLQRNTFDIGELALEMQEHGYFREYGYETLAEYGEQELGIKSRKLQYLARIVRVCRECGVARKDYEPVGVSKLRLITSLDPDSSYYDREIQQHIPMVNCITELISEGIEMSTQEIEERVAHLKGMDDDNAMIHRSYSVTKSAYENTIVPALEAMRKLLGSQGRDDEGRATDFPDGKCIEFILRDWHNDPRNTMEDTDCSQETLEIPLEENNEQ